MNMSPAYVAVTLEETPDAKEKIAFDHFHITKMITSAVDAVRKAEVRTLHKELKRQGLQGKRFHWLRNSDSLSKTQRVEISALRSIASKTGRAWLLKEYARQLWHYSSRPWTEKENENRAETETQKWTLNFGQPREVDPESWTA